MLKIQWFFVALLTVALIACSGGDKDDVDVKVSISEAENVGMNSALLFVQFKFQNDIEEVGCMYSTARGKLNVNAFDTYSGKATAEFAIFSAMPSVSGVFECDLQGLMDDTEYFVKPYIKLNKATKEFYKGYFLPDDKLTSFKTTTTATFTDSRDGRTYRMKKFGSYTWMIDDLRYNSQTSTYSWEIALEICPDGWHLPNNSEWDFLTDNLGNRAEIYFGSSYWWSSNTNVPCQDICSYAWYVEGDSLKKGEGTIRGNFYPTDFYSVRCVKD